MVNKTSSKYLSFYISYFNILMTDGRYTAKSRMNKTIYNYLFNSNVSLVDQISDWGLLSKWVKMKSK